MIRTPMKISTKKISRFSSPVRNSIAMIHAVKTMVIFSDISTVYSPIFRWKVTFFPLCVVSWIRMGCFAARVTAVSAALQMGQGYCRHSEVLLSQVSVFSSSNFQVSSFFFRAIDGRRLKPTKVCSFSSALSNSV